MTMVGSSSHAITIFSGRFGSGKTEAALNYALLLARSPAPSWLDPASVMRDRSSEDIGQGNRVVLIDLDIVTPYFRSREMADRMKELKVNVVAPSIIGQHLDMPAITPQILGAIEQPSRPVVLDVGGDQQGARALGQFSAAIRRRGYTMYFVVNPYRPFTSTPEGLANSIAEIEASARLQVTSLVSNPNLIGETTARAIIDGHAQIEAFARDLGMPIAFVCLERHWHEVLGPNHFAQPTLVLDRHFVMSWETE
jgi:hypothetical protein